MDVFCPVRKAKILQLSFSTKRNPLTEGNRLDKQAVLIRAKKKSIRI